MTGGPLTGGLEANAVTTGNASPTGSAGGSADQSR
jgi:hypothetical protein